MTVNSVTHLLHLFILLLYIKVHHIINLDLCFSFYYSDKV